eukprot:1563526-Alexandrium_andersonii.AAC.1
MLGTHELANFARSSIRATSFWHWQSTSLMRGSRASGRELGSGDEAELFIIVDRGRHLVQGLLEGVLVGLGPGPLRVRLDRIELHLGLEAGGGVALLGGLGRSKEALRLGGFG